MKPRIVGIDMVKQPEGTGPPVSGGNAWPGFVPPKGPFPYNTLRPPLTSGQRAQVLAYLKQFWDKSVGGTDTKAGLTSPTWAQLTVYSDNSLINIYDSIVGNTKTPPGADPGAVTPGIGPLPNPLSGLNSLADFFNVIGKSALWLRITEGILGIMLIGVALSKMTGQSPTDLIKKAAIL